MKVITKVDLHDVVESIKSILENQIGHKIDRKRLITNIVSTVLDREIDDKIAALRLKLTNRKLDTLEHFEVSPFNFDPIPVKEVPLTRSIQRSPNGWAEIPIDTD